MTADPRWVPGACVIPRLSYRLCCTLAHLGGRVLHARSADLAARHHVPLVVRSSFEDHPGTRIEDEGAHDPGGLMKTLEGPTIVAVTHQSDTSIAIAEGNAGGKGEAREIIAAAAAAVPEMQLIAHEQSGGVHHALIWMGERADAETLKARFHELRGPGMEWRLDVEHGCGFVSVIGLGLGGAEVARAEAAFERAGVSMIALRVTPTALVFRVPGDRLESAVQALHQAMIGSSSPG
jgi:aspartate kinase